MISRLYGDFTTPSAPIATSGGVADTIIRLQMLNDGALNAGKVEVMEGLTGAEQVVVVGQNGLKDGNPVRVVTLEQTAKAGS